MKKAKTTALSGIAIALYIVVMYFSQSISFGQYQIRLATSLYGLVFSFPFLCIPLGIANMLSNILFGGDFVNGFFGLLAGVLTTKCICLLKRLTSRKILLVLPIAIIPSLVVPVWLSYSLNVPYLFLVGSLLIGQAITAFSCGISVMVISEKLKLSINEDP